MKSWTIRYQTFQSAYSRLAEIVPMDLSTKDDVYQEALVKRFEIMIQITKNVLRDFLKTQGSEPRYLEHPKDIFREAYRCGCLDDVGVWLDAIDYRNQAAHIYHSEILQRTVSFVTGHFWPQLQQLEQFFQKKLSP